MKLIFDFSQLSYRSFFTMQSSNIEVDYDFWRYNILRMIIKTKKLFDAKGNDEIILACDAGSWRKDVFEYYKAGRAEGRNETHLKMFEEMEQFEHELAQLFPFIVLKVDKCEADDVIAMLVMNKPEDEIAYIVSTDKDFIQLLKYNKTWLYNPTKEDFVGDEWPLELGGMTFESPKQYSQYHILRAGDDGIPNCLSDDDTFVNKEKRQKQFGVKKIKQIFEYGFEKWIMEQPKEIINNVERNRKLVVLSENTIPLDLQQNILNAYKNFKLVRDKEKIMDYLEYKEMRTLFDKVNDFLD